MLAVAPEKIISTIYSKNYIIYSLSIKFLEECKFLCLLQFYDVANHAEFVNMLPVKSVVPFVQGNTMIMKGGVNTHEFSSEMKRH